MKIFTKTIRVLGVSSNEMDGLLQLVNDARKTGKAEIQTGPNQFLAVEVNDMYAYREPRESR